jgi:hypothetical protein
MIHDKAPSGRTAARGQLRALTVGRRGRGDATAQRALMNNLPDAFADRIIGVDFDKLCTLSYAKKKVGALRSRMPESVAALLLPTVDRAVNALAEVQNGLFIQKQRGDEMVRLRQPDGKCKERSPERAARYGSKSIETPHTATATARVRERRTNSTPASSPSRWSNPIRHRLAPICLFA